MAVKRSSPTGVNHSRLKIDGKKLDEVLSKYDFDNMTRGEAEDGMTEKEIKFCREYLRIYSVAQAAYNAGATPSTAHLWGAQTIRKERCIRYITWLKRGVEQEAFYDSVDMMKLLIAIVNADITDYAKFGTVKKLARDSRGNIIYKDGEPMLEYDSQVLLKSSKKVDGRLLQEVGHARGGAYVKMFDKLKALEVLSNFSPTTYKMRQELEAKKLELLEKKLDIEKQKLDEGNTEEVDDGFIAALNSDTKTTWEDFEVKPKKKKHKVVDDE